MNHYQNNYHQNNHHQNNCLQNNHQNNLKVELLMWKQFKEVKNLGKEFRGEKNSKKCFYIVNFCFAGSVCKV